MIQSVKKALTILEVLSDHYNSPLPLTHLAKAAQINPSTASHIIDTLEEKGFVVKISRSKGYILGPAAYCLSRFGNYKKDLIASCYPILRFINKKTGYTAILAIMEKDSKYILHTIDNNHIYDTPARIRKDEIFRTATGRALLVNLPQSEVQKIFKQYGNHIEKDWPEVPNFDSFLKYVNTIDKHCVFKSRIQFSGIANLGYGIPVFSLSHCIGAIGVAVKLPLEDEEIFIENEEQQIIKFLEFGAKDCMRRISKSS